MNVFITGGTSGLGEAMAIHYASLSEKNRVGVCSFDPLTYENATKLKAFKNILFFEADVTNLTSMQKAFGQFLPPGQKLDLMIANAGISYHEKKYFQSVHDSLKIMRVNVDGVINTFEVAMTRMIAQKSGHIVAMSSIAASNGLPTRAAYSASKSAVQKWCEAMAIELASVGVSVSCVKPGFIKTKLTATNNHAMPFALTIDETVAKIVRGIEKKQFIISFPWPLVWVTNILEMLPRCLYIAVMKKSSSWLKDKKD